MLSASPKAFHARIGQTVHKEIDAKVLLSHTKQPDTCFGLRYNMNLYRGCEHSWIFNIL